MTSLAFASGFLELMDRLHKIDEVLYLSILKFSVSAELDLKEQTFTLNKSNVGNFFKLISFNTAHMALTSLLRCLIEIITATVLIIYIAIFNLNII